MLDKGTDLSTWPGARRVSKLPIPVEVRFAEERGICQTLEGPVAFEPGDPVLTGVEGEQWTMPRARFDAVYAPMTPDGAGRAGRYRKRPLAVVAVALSAPLDVDTGGGRGVLHGKRGDWLVQHGPGDFGIVAPGIFEKTYRFVDE